MIFAATLALHLASGVHVATRDATPAAAHAERTVSSAGKQDALAYYQDLISRLETVDIDSPEAVSARLGMRFVRDPLYQPGRPYWHWLAIMPASRHRPAARIEYLQAPGQRHVHVAPLGRRPTQTEFIAIYPEMRIRPDNGLFRTGPPEVEFDLRGRGNEIKLIFSQVEPHRLRHIFFLSRHAEPSTGPFVPAN